ncbi:MAG TPA: hypothetical protein VK636_15630, partial [Gemmatimonadaceae bacterium]|nr:hypothetical protein [Gemmatimonadaceae bacterium]
TGIVFELFDVKAELRAICGGGRYDNLLHSLGGVDLPALGFGMGDVVLSDLVRERGLFPTTGIGPQVWLAANPDDPTSEYDVRELATKLRRAGVSVEYALKQQSLNSQEATAKKLRAGFFVALPQKTLGGAGDWDTLEAQVKAYSHEGSASTAASSPMAAVPVANLVTFIVSELGQPG